MIFIEIT